MEKNQIEIRIDNKEIDETIEKANRLKELLQEVRELIHSLGDII